MITKMIGNKEINIIESEMSKEMDDEAIDCAILAVIKHTKQSDIAEYMVDKFNNKYGKYWCCLIGQGFGATYYHRLKHYICFDLDQLRITLFKTP
ncbi:Dynein light chain [Meloidogyne graminicola]|uniref:Dynein light chain n=1 Tax=Meloidogyne graminicola TaxID=189291 RepID=A0A8S9ZTY5_9BILA|nr:Dynein light chain [Meloidogyne graminicola]